MRPDITARLIRLLAYITEASATEMRVLKLLRAPLANAG